LIFARHIELAPVSEEQLQARNQVAKPVLRRKVAE
jgi:hypothetical protein